MYRYGFGRSRLLYNGTGIILGHPPARPPPRRVRTTHVLLASRRHRPTSYAVCTDRITRLILAIYGRATRLEPFLNFIRFPYFWTISKPYIIIYPIFCLPFVFPIESSSSSSEFLIRSRAQLGICTMHHYTGFFIFFFLLSSNQYFINDDFHCTRYARLRTRDLLYTGFYVYFRWVSRFPWRKFVTFRYKR